MGRHPFPRPTNPRPMNRRLAAKALRRKDLNGMLRYGFIPAVRAITDAFNDLPEVVKRAIAQTAALAAAVSSEGETRDDT